MEKNLIIWGKIENQSNPKKRLYRVSLDQQWMFNELQNKGINTEKEDILFD